MIAILFRLPSFKWLHKLLHDLVLNSTSSFFVGSLRHLAFPYKVNAICIVFIDGRLLRLPSKPSLPVVWKQTSPYVNCFKCLHFLNFCDLRAVLRNPRGELSNFQHMESMPTFLCLTQDIEFNALETLKNNVIYFLRPYAGDIYRMGHCSESN